ncbi:MAG: hypothetical protein COC15_03455 [Legionellales bacterium]|nr:MAG: hypothetical protein COC15_03455 [Legionellales bacterium]
MERSELAIVIPAFNEEYSIAKVVVSAMIYGVVIVVDDASTDNTAKIAENAGATIVAHLSNKGYDGSINSGFIEADKLGCKYVVTIDADGQHEVTEIAKYIDAFNSSIDLVLGVRNKYARFSEKVFSLMTRFLYKVKDPLCGMKGYNMSLYKKIGHFDSYNSIGTELALTSVKNGCLFKEILVQLNDRQDTSRFGNIILGNLRIFRAMLLCIFKI